MLEMCIGLLSDFDHSCIIITFLSYVELKSYRRNILGLAEFRRTGFGETTTMRDTRSGTAEKTRNTSMGRLNSLHGKKL